jgi:hypothetical protein
MEVVMTPQDRIKADIDTLLGSVKQDWKDLNGLRLDANERARIRMHVQWCIKELADLAHRLDAPDSERL